MAKARISQALLVDEAIRLLEEGGLAAVSLHKIAASLGVRAPSLYKHVAGKSHLYSMMSAQLFSSCVEAVPDCRSWDNWLTAFAEILWDSQRRADGVLQLIAYHREKKGDRRGPAQLIQRLVTLGVPPDDADALQDSVQAYITGWTMMHHSALGDTRSNFRRGLDALLEGWRTSFAARDPSYSIPSNITN